MNNPAQTGLKPSNSGKDKKSMKGKKSSSGWHAIILKGTDKNSIQEMIDEIHRIVKEARAEKSRKAKKDRNK